MTGSINGYLKGALDDGNVNMSNGHKGRRLELMKTWTLHGDQHIGSFKDNTGSYEIIFREGRYLMVPIDKEVTETDVMVLPVNELVEWLALPCGSMKSYYSIKTEYGWEVGIAISLLNRVNIKIHSLYSQDVMEGTEKFLDISNEIYKNYHKTVFREERITNPFENNIIVVMGTIDYVDQLPSLPIDDDMVRCYIVRYEGTSKENKMIPWDREFFYFKRQWLTYNDVVAESKRK